MDYKTTLIRMAERLSKIVIEEAESTAALCEAARTAADLIDLAAELGDGDNEEG